MLDINITYDRLKVQILLNHLQAIPNKITDSFRQATSALNRAFVVRILVIQEEIRKKINGQGNNCKAVQQEGHHTLIRLEHIGTMITQWILLISRIIIYKAIILKLRTTINPIKLLNNIPTHWDQAVLYSHQERITSSGMENRWKGTRQQQTCWWTRHSIAFHSPIYPWQAVVKLNSCMRSHLRGINDQFHQLTSKQRFFLRSP